MATATYRDFTIEHAGIEVPVHLITETRPNGEQITTVEVEMGAGMDFALVGEPTLDDLIREMDDTLFSPPCPNR